MKKHFYFLILLIFFLRGEFSQAVQKAKIINQDANVYKLPDFDSEVLYELEKGDVFDVSNISKGPFYRIRLKKDILGWIADNDIEILDRNGNAKKRKHTSRDRDLDKDDKDEDEKDVDENGAPALGRPIEEVRVMGPVISLVNFTEETMASTRNELLTMYGFKWAGPNALMTGPISTEAQLLLGFKSPGYYETVTKQSSKGFMSLLDVSIQSPIFTSHNRILQYGLGPLVRYSSFTNQVDGESFNAVDLNLGAQVNLSYQARVSWIFVRGDLRYILEKKAYFALGLSFLFSY